MGTPRRVLIGEIARTLPLDDKPSKRDWHVPALFLCLGLTVVIVGIWRNNKLDHTFDSGVWQSYDPTVAANPRAAMVDDLIKNHLKPGLTRGNVLKLLGPADTERKGAWVYWIEHGRIAEAKTTQDFDYRISMRVLFDDKDRVSPIEFLDPTDYMKGKRAQPGGMFAP